MTTLLDLIKALADRPEPLPEPRSFIAHPAWTENEGALRILRAMQEQGVDVRVQTDIRLPSVSLGYWLGRPKPDSVTPYRNSTFAELERQAHRLRREALQANRGLPDFIVTPEELDEILRANGGAGMPAGATFHGMKLRVVYP